MAYIALTPGPDFFIDSDLSHNIYGMAGDDSIEGRGGDDLLHGGKGDDFLIGGAGDDDLRGAAGNDVMVGGPGFDTMLGRAGGDTFLLNQGIADGGAGADWFQFGDFNGPLWDGNPAQTVATQAIGGAGADTFNFSAVGSVFDPADSYRSEVLDFKLGEDTLNFSLVATVDGHTILDDATTKDWLDTNNDGSISAADGFREEIGWGVTTSADGQGIDIHVSGDEVTLHGTSHLDFAL